MAESAPSPTVEEAVSRAANDPIHAARQRSNRLLHRRALMAAVASAVPMPGLDWAVDAALLSRLLPQISAEFGLSAEQIDRLDPSSRERVQKAAGLVGSVLIGKFITRDVVLRLAQTVGVRLTTKQIAKYVPLAGQAVSAALGYAILRHLGKQHIRDCESVCRTARLPPPPPPTAARTPGT